MIKPFKKPPTYAIASVDHALRLGAILQMEGGLTVSEAADRLGVARSTAHRLLAMLVYRDFAVQDDGRVYRAGPLLELAAHSPSVVSALRAAALPHMQRLVDRLDETSNLAVRTGDGVRFILSVECRQALRVGSREGMVFPAHRTTAGLVLLAELTPSELDGLYRPDPPGAGLHDLPDMAWLRSELSRVRRRGFAVNRERSERGLVAIGVAVRAPDGSPQAGLSVSMPSVRYDQARVPSLVATLRSESLAIERALDSKASPDRRRPGAG